MNDRAVSVTVNYALGLVIATLLLSGLVFAAGDMLESRQETTIRGELDVLGQRLAAGLMTADRLAEAGGDEVAVEVSLPDRVAGSSYDIDVEASASDAFLRLESHHPTATANVSYINRTSIESTTVTGGTVRIVLAADGDLEVEAA